MIPLRLTMPMRVMKPPPVRHGQAGRTQPQTRPVSPRRARLQGLAQEKEHAGDGQAAQEKQPAVGLLLSLELAAVLHPVIAWQQSYFLLHGDQLSLDVADYG